MGLYAKGDGILREDFKLGSDMERFQACSFVCLKPMWAPLWRINGGGVSLNLGSVNLGRTTVFRGKMVFGLGSNNGDGQK